MTNNYKMFLIDITVNFNFRALDRNEYNHITATYFLLAERKLRAHRQEQAQNRIKQNQILINITPTAKNSLQANPAGNHFGLLR